MTEALRAYDYDDYSSEDGSEEELATSYLESSAPQAVQTVPQGETEHSVEDSGPLVVTDWLALLTPRPTGEILDDEPPASQPLPEGMSMHLKPARMRTTLAARLGSGLRRLVLVALLIGFAGAALAGGAYLLVTSSWLAPAVPQIGQAPAEQPEAPEGLPPGSTLPTQPDQPGTTGQIPWSDFAQMREQGISELKAGHYSNAIELLETAAAVNEADAVTEYQLGLAYMAVPDQEHSAQDAEMAFRSTISLQPEWAAPYTLLAESLIRQEQYAAAVDPANKAVQIDPNKAEAWMTLGRAYQGAGQPNEATRAYAEAARLAPAPPNP